MIHMCPYVFIQHALFWGHNILPVESGDGWILKQPDYSSFSDKSYQMRAACSPILNPARIYHSESRMKRRLWCLCFESVSPSLSSEEPITSAKNRNLVLEFHLSLAQAEQGFDSVKPRNKTCHWKPPNRTKTNGIMHSESPEKPACWQSLSPLASSHLTLLSLFLASSRFHIDEHAVWWLLHVGNSRYLHTRTETRKPRRRKKASPGTTKELPPVTAVHLKGKDSIFTYLIDCCISCHSRWLCVSMMFVMVCSSYHLPCLVWRREKDKQSTVLFIILFNNHTRLKKFVDVNKVF